MPIIVDKPHCLPGDECNHIMTLVQQDSLNEASNELTKIVQLAFESGVGFEGSVPAAPVAAAKVTSGKSLPDQFRSYADIDEDSPKGPIENFIYRNQPTDNVEMFRSQLMSMLKYVAANYDN